MKTIAPLWEDEHSHYLSFGAARDNEIEIRSTDAAWLAYNAEPGCLHCSWRIAQSDHEKN